MERVISKLKYILCLLLIAMSCNTSFFVDSDNVIRKEEGFIIIGSHDLDVSFLPLKMDTSLTILQNFKNIDTYESHLLVNLGAEKVRYLRFIAEKADHSYYIIPVELEYREVYNKGWEETEKYGMLFELDSTIFEIKLGPKYLVHVESLPFFNYETINNRNLEYILEK